MDNVSIRANAELTEDTTVNALYFALPAKLDLNGHTLTVKSGSIYFNVDQNCYVTNGFLKLENPGLFYHPKYSSNRGIHCPILPADSATIFSAPFGFCGSGLFTGAHQWLSQMKGFVRIPPFGGSGNGASRTITNRSAPDVIWEFEGHSNHPYIGPVKLVDTFAHYRGFAGDGHVIYCVSSVNVKGTNTAAWLGDKEESDTIQTQQLVVGPNGYLLPGSPDEEGYRTGAMVFSMISSAEKGYTNLIFKANSKFCVTVRPDGDCTYLETRNWSKQNTDIIIEGGDIVVTKTERFEPSQSYSIIRAHRPITGNFTNVSSGWKAEVVQTSANLYELMLVPHPSATLMILR